jgi:hypothetical protein
MAGGASGAAALSFDEMMDKDRADSTKGQYKSLSKHFVQFLSVRNAGLVREDQSVDLNAVTVDDLKAFFDHVSIKRQSVKRDGLFSAPVEQVNGKHVLNSASYVGSYRSALKWFYEPNHVEVPVEVMKQLG